MAGEEPHTIDANTFLKEPALQNHKICGMHVNMVQALRGAVREGPSAVRDLAIQFVRGLKRSLAGQDGRVLVAIGKTRGPALVILTGDEDDWSPSHRYQLADFEVVIFYMLDPLDIDSKQISLINDSRTPPASRDDIFSKLYKKDLTV